ncbi:MAG: hypothetical protein RIM72_23325 [Alphaproteobacteria bacterium]
MDDLERMSWSFAAIAVFAVLIIWFRGRKSGRWLGLVSIALAIAVTIGLAIKLTAE